MNLEIAQFDTTDSWEDRTLRKLNLNFRQVQGGLDYLQSTVLRMAEPVSGRGKEVIWVNPETEPPFSDQSTSSSNTLEIQLPLVDYDFLIVTWRLSRNATAGADYYYSQIVPAGMDFVLQQISGAGSVPIDSNQAAMYVRDVTYDASTNKLTFGRVKIARTNSSWNWANDQNAMIIMSVCGIRF